METMQAFLAYNAKVAVCLAVFYLFYKVLLSRETFHRLNRAVLVGIIVSSFLLPVCRVTIYREVPVAPASVTAETAIESAAGQPMFDWTLLLAAVFAAGAAAATLRTAVSVGTVVRIIREGRHERLDRQAILVRLSRAVTPFSWMRWIVVDERDLETDGDMIIAHEHAHIRLHHSYDLVVTDLLTTLQWFNPAMWLLRAELRAVHEYEADAAVLAGGVDAKEYQMFLIKKAVGERWCSVANGLNHSKLKNRITMMLRKKSSRWTTARVLFVVPLACIAGAAFARTVTIPVEDKVTENHSIIELSPDKVQPKHDTIHVVGIGVKETAAADKETDAKSRIVKHVVYVVDGRVVDSMDGIDTDAIESITVLKDKAAISLYGEKAKDGVVMISIKGGIFDLGDDKPREWYIDGRKATEEEVKALPNDRIANMNIDKFEDRTRIDITTKDGKKALTE